METYLEGLDSYIKLDEERELQNKREFRTLEEALSNIDRAVEIVDDAIKIFNEDESLKKFLEGTFLNLNAAGVTLPTMEEANLFLEGLTPSKVKSLLPGHEVTPQEKRALTFTKEERAARRTGTPEEAQEATKARGRRAKAFLTTLSTYKFVTLLARGTSGGRYHVFTPTTTTGEDYNTISTTQFYRVTNNVINLADFVEAAEIINRRKKKKVADAGTMKNDTYEAIQVRERGGELTLAIRKDLPPELLNKVSENGEKELDFVTSQIYKRGYDTTHNQLKEGVVITISDDDLVKNKVCGTDNRKVNRRNFLTFLTVLQSTQAAALTVTKGKGKKGEEPTRIDKIDIVPLFKRITLPLSRGDVYELVPNDEFDWTSALKYYTYLPPNSYALSGRAYKLLKAILEKARLTAADREDPSTVYLPLTTAADVLRLPLETTETKKLIKTPVRNIVNEINGNIEDICLTLNTNEDANKADYLAGSLTATFSGELLSSYERLKVQKGKNIKKQIAKHNRAINAQKQREANAAAKVNAGKK